MKLHRGLLAVLTIFQLSCASAPKPKAGVPRPWQKPTIGGYQEAAVDVFGSRFVIRVWPAVAHVPVPLNQALALAANEIRRIAKIADASDPSSEVAQFNLNSYKTPVKASQELVSILMTAQQMYELSDHRFDVTFVPYKIKDLKEDDYNAITHWDRMNPPLPATVTHMFGPENVIYDPKTMLLRRYNRRLKLNLKGMIRGYIMNRAMDVLSKQGLPGYAVFADGLSGVAGTAMKDPQLTCVENPNVLGTCMYRVTPTDSVQAFYIGNSASLERRGEMYDPKESWGYRSGGVIIAGYSGEWVQFGTTVLTLMEDGDVIFLLDKLKHQRIAGAYFDKTAFKEFHGNLAPVAEIARLVK